ncbi:hypothetical protein AAC387_Pa04g2389 [Persea americana]
MEAGEDGRTRTDCYRTPGPTEGRRNYTYMDAVKSFLGKIMRYSPICIALGNSDRVHYYISYKYDVCGRYRLLPFKGAQRRMWSNRNLVQWKLFYRSSQTWRK